jgi:8-oxo-dGDP phosphatase
MKKKSDNNWETTSTREVYKNTWIRVREDKIIHPSGKTGIYGVVEMPVGVYAIAFNEEDKLLMIKQSHYPTGLNSWGLPAGALKPGSTLQEQVLEELKEESGYSAKKLLEIGTMQAQPGITTQIDHYFVASDIFKIESPETMDLQLQEGITEVDFFSLEEIDSMVSRGQITHGQTLSGLYLYKSRIKHA